jgi:hypothetical protein
LDRDFDGTLRTHIVNVIGAARIVNKAVVLALDGVYGRDGLNEKATKFMVANRYAQRLAAEHADKVLFGASVNPARPDAELELRRCLALEPWPGEKEIAGPPAALVKSVPNTQGFDPQCVSDGFCKVLNENETPLLVHGGREHTLPVELGNQGLGNPGRLKQVLGNGVKVIVAHCAARINVLELSRNFTAILADMMRQASREGWRLFANVSARSSPTRGALVVQDVLDRIAGPHGDRLVLGSDYPVPPRQVPGVDNPLDRNLEWLRQRGFPAELATRSADLINPKAKQWAGVSPGS